MKEKTIAWILILGIIVLFVLVSAAQWFLFNSENCNFTRTVEDAIRSAYSGDWVNAQKQAKKADDIWNRGNFIVAVKYAETDYTFLNVYLTRFQLAIAQKDADEAAKEGFSALYIFNNITSVSPKP